MQRHTRTNIMLLAMVVLLFGAVLAEIKREEWLRPEVLAHADLHAVKQIEVRCNGCRTRRFEKALGLWWMREPYALPADDAAVARLLSIVGAPVRKRHAATEFDPHRLGLEPPQATLALDALSITFGTTDAINGDRYVRVHDAINLVPDRFSAWLYATPESEVDRRPVPRNLKVLGVSLHGAAERADLVAAWQNATALEIGSADGTSAPPGTDTPVALRLDNETTLHFALGKRGDRYAATRADLPLVYWFDPAAATALLGASATAAH